MFHKKTISYFFPFHIALTEKTIANINKKVINSLTNSESSKFGYGEIFDDQPESLTVK